MMSETQILEERRDAVRVAVFSGIAHRRVVRRRRDIALVAGAGLLLAAGAAAGATQLATPAQYEVDHFIRCYPTASLDGEPMNIGNGEGDAPLDVVTTCEDFWRQGQLGQTPAPEPNDMSTVYPVPEIAACLTREGTAAGFPIWDRSETPEELCARLQLAVWDPALQS